MFLFLGVVLSSVMLSELIQFKNHIAVLFGACVHSYYNRVEGFSVDIPAGVGTLHGNIV